MNLKIRIKKEFLGWIAFYYGGPILTLFAFLTHFIFLPGNLLASILWASICGIYFLFQCMQCTKVEGKIKLKNGILFYLAFLFIFFVLIQSILAISGSFTPFSTQILFALLFAFYSIPSTLAVIYLLSILHILKPVKKTDNHQEKEKL